MKIKKILLTDDCDEFYTDLIEFNRETTKEEVYEVIYKCIKDLPGEYTNEDIYNYLDKYIGIKSIEFLSYERVYY
jgi:hypothetical protein